MRSEGVDCARIEADLILLLDGGLDRLRGQPVNAHLQSCTACADFFRRLRGRLVEGFSELPDSGPEDWPKASPLEPSPVFTRLAARMRRAELAELGKLLYEILKAEFLYDYGDGVEAASDPIDDPAGERRRAAAMVNELREWVDDDRIDGVDLRAIGRHFSLPVVDCGRLDELIGGMSAVARLNPMESDNAAYYRALAHIKARRPGEAELELLPLCQSDHGRLGRYATITLATLPALLLDRPLESIPRLEACLIGDDLDALVHFNLAKAHFLAADELCTASTYHHLSAARSAAPELVESQIGRASERGLRLAALAYEAAAELVESQIGRASERGLRLAALAYEAAAELSSGD